ncbi:MAG TPA: putative baseplate assembly protein [Rhizomicrobium sp.]|jgi:hypothetical protein
MATCGCLTLPCTCGCCAGISAVTPLSEYNATGLDALVYRAGTYGDFFETMLARLSSLWIDITPLNGIGTNRVYPLRALTTRDTSDASIALLDAWAVLADVMTFYQERIANEGYLRTAIERRSILELARLVGYRLRPGVSASVYLAFTCAQSFNGTISAGARAQSLPDPGQLPQFFETSNDLAARDSWNAMKPRLTRPQAITPQGSMLADRPSPTDVSLIDTIYLDGTSTNLKTGSALIFSFGDQIDSLWLRRVESVTPQDAQNRTEILLSDNFGDLDTGKQIQLYIDKATYLFQDSSIANDVVGILTSVLGASDASVIPLAVAQLREKMTLANSRGFSRVSALIAHILEFLPGFTPDHRVIVAPGTKTFPLNLQLVQSALRSSALGNLVDVANSLAKPASLQPANPLRLAISIKSSFGPQSDVAPRLIATFNPKLSPSLYGSWRNVARPPGAVQVYAARATAGLFANRFSGPATVPSVGSKPTYSSPTLLNAWSSLITNDGAGPPSAVALDSTYDQVKPGSWVAIDRPEIADPVNGTRTVTYHKVHDARTASMDTTTGFTASVTLLALDPQWLSELSASDMHTALGSNVLLRHTVVYAQAEAVDMAQEPLDVEVGTDKISLDAVYNGLQAGRWVIVSGNRIDVGNAGGVPTSELAMLASVAQGSEPPNGAAAFADIPFGSVLYTTAANSLGDRLVVGTVDSPADFYPRLQKLPLPAVINQQYSEQIQIAPGVYVNAYVPSAQERKGIFSDFTGMLLDPSGAPVPNGTFDGLSALLDPSKGPTFFAWRISTPQLHTILHLAAPLAYTYDAGSVSVLGNVVEATNGQTTGEVLGDGDGSQSFQTFGLHQSPVTYVSAPTVDGTQSSLLLRVNEIEWHETDTLAFAGPRDRVFVTATDDDDNMTVTFGDGVNGARVPTGTANVKATYRYGIGSAGNVASGKISQMTTQPLGVQSVINPLESSGGADRDGADEARANTPIAVMALDRLVSVKDYADFSRAYAGIGKASSTRISDGRRQLVHVSIAGARDIPIDTSSDLFRNLLTSLETYGDPSLPVALAVRKLKLLVMSADVLLEPDYDWEDVAPVIRSALLDQFAFGARALGQSAFLSEAVRVAQDVEGVSYVNFRVFDQVAEDATAETLASLAATLTLNSYVRSNLAQVNPDPAATGDQRILPAELVMLTPDIAETLILTNLGS